MCFQLASRVFPLRFDRAGEMVGPVCSSPRGHLLGKHHQQPHSLHDESQHRQRDRLHSAGEKFFVRNKPGGSGFVLICSGSTLDLDRRKTDILTVDKVLIVKKVLAVEKFLTVSKLTS
jgi:hypothetical protein